MLHRTLTAAATVPLLPQLWTPANAAFTATSTNSPNPELPPPAVPPALVPLSSCSRHPTRRTRTTPRRVFPPSAQATSTPHLHLPFYRYIRAVLLFTLRLQPAALTVKF